LYIPTFHSKSGFAWERDYTLDEFVRVVSQSPLEFQPGDRYAYCNTGYYLLGMIIERVSGKPYAEFVAERIFRPLQMTATRRMDRRKIIPNRASGYAWQKNARQNAEYSSATWAYAEGGLVSSVSDLAKWDAALYTEQLLTRSTLEQMFTPAKLNNGEATGYGFGWYVNTYGSHKRRVSHGGSKPGFSTHIARCVDDRLSVIVLANAWGAGADALAQGVAAFYLPVPEPIEDKDPQTTQRLKSVLLGLAAGRADPALFTAEAHAELLPTVQQAQRFYQSLGPLKSFQLVEQKSEEQSRTYRYRSILGETPWTHTFVVTKTGKIAEVRAAPE
jgi:CubicO group peptidase (beta-lactamase class C family)